MTEKYRKDDVPPSEMFIDSMSEGGYGSSELRCDWCGRRHLCPDARYYDTHCEDEGDSHSKYCLAEHKEDPDGVVLNYDCDSVMGRDLAGMIFVIGCPCNGLNRYEAFIWGNKDTIRKYLKKRIDHEYELAQQQLTLNKLAGL